MDTYGSVDWGPNCSRTAFVANPGSLIVRQDLKQWNGSTAERCNDGPWIRDLNNGRHDLATGFGWGAPPCRNPEWYQQWASVYFWGGGGWRGATIALSWQALSSW